MAFLSPLDNVGDGATDGKVDGCGFLCLLRRGDFSVFERCPVPWADRLVGAFCCKYIQVIERGGQVCWDMILEHKGPGLMPLSSKAS